MVAMTTMMRCIEVRGGFQRWQCGVRGGGDLGGWWPRGGAVRDSDMKKWEQDLKDLLQDHLNHDADNFYSAISGVIETPLNNHNNLRLGPTTANHNCTMRPKTNGVMGATECRHFEETILPSNKRLNKWEELAEQAYAIDRRIIGTQPFVLYNLAPFQLSRCNKSVSFSPHFHDLED
ncbi:hypothetical protein Tco_0193699 [Tanacetum coccineum]